LFVGQSEQTLEEVVKSIKHVILVLSGEGGAGKSTVYDTDSMDSLQQKKEGWHTECELAWTKYAKDDECRGK